MVAVRTITENATGWVYQIFRHKRWSHSWKICVNGTYTGYFSTASVARLIHKNRLPGQITALSVMDLLVNDGEDLHGKR